MAEQKIAGPSRDNKGRFRRCLSMHEAGRRKNLGKIWEHKLPDREEVCLRI